MGNFVKHISCDSCNSSDGMALYDDSSTFCFVCGAGTVSEEFKQERKNKKYNRKQKRKDVNVSEENVKLKPIVTEAETLSIKSKTGLKAFGYRGIDDAILRKFGVRTQVDDDDNVIATFYPCTSDYVLSGWKRRVHPKDFSGSVGRTGNGCELFGQFAFQNPSSSKVCLIVGGEHDQLAAYQMLKGYYDSKKYGFDPVVVSPTVGETGCQKQVSSQYPWFDKFDKIIIGFDGDKAGREATESVAAVLPKGKIFVANWSNKDPNKMLTDGQERKFISEFYEAKPYVPVGVIGSNQISDSMRQEFLVEKIPLPPFMHKLQAMMAGGIPLGRIVNLGSASGTGKSTIIDEIIYYMIFNSPHLVGVVTLEATKGQYGVKLISRHIGKKLELLDNEEALRVLNSDEVKKEEVKLLSREDGTPRFYLVDDRDGEVEDLQGAIENLIISCGCKVIVCDPVSDIIQSLPNEEQENFMSWQKGMVKSHGVTFLNVCHTRKTANGQKAGSAGADIHEEDIIGSSSLYKSAACNLMFSRNKESEDVIEKNTTIMKATKIRWTGKTGIAGKYYYDIERHILHDLDDYLNVDV